MSKKDEKSYGYEVPLEDYYLDDEGNWRNPWHEIVGRVGDGQNLEVD